VALVIYLYDYKRVTAQLRAKITQCVLFDKLTCSKGGKKRKQVLSRISSIAGLLYAKSELIAF
jgi:hypothetical protein